ncbi:unnamed protein product [Closterium sp. NIES-54]
MPPRESLQPNPVKLICYSLVDCSGLDNMGPVPPFECPQPVQSQSLLQPVSPLPAPSPYTGPTGGLAERRAPASRPASPARPACTSRRTSRPRPPAVPGTHQMALRPSTAPLRVPLPSPPASSLPAFPDPEFPICTHLLSSSFIPVSSQIRHMQPSLKVSRRFVQREHQLQREVVITVANNQNLRTRRQGVVQLQSRDTNVILQMSKVLIAEGLGYNLLSISQLMAKGIHLEANSTTQDFKLYHGKGGLHIGKVILKNNVFVLDFVPDLGTADSDGIVTFTSWTHPLDLDPDFSPEGFWHLHTIPEAERTRALATIQHSAAEKTTSAAAKTTSAAAETTAVVTSTPTAVQTSPQASTPTPTCIVAHPDIALAKTSGTHEWDIQAIWC